MKPVAICKSKLSQQHTNSNMKIDGWEEWLEKRKIKYEYVDCYSYDIISKLDNYSALLWWYENFAVADLLEAQNIIDIAESRGIKVYPNHNTAWHFDDKIAEMYALQNIGAPIPQSWVFYDLGECIDWLTKKAEYPLVAKLRCGSGSNNVHLISEKKQAIKYAKRMFGKGFQPAPSLAYKTFSKIQSTHDWKTFVSRLKRVPDFIWTRRYAKQMPMERGYCYFQEYVPNDGYDLKISVVGDKLGFIVRKSRKGDFRASGGGEITYKRELITDEIISSAFSAADSLKTQCMGFDYVVNRETGKGLIIEMCHGFDHDAMYASGGYYDRQFRWIDKPLNVSEEIIKNLLLEEQ